MDILEFGRGVLQQQPFSQLLGAELAQFEQGFAELHLPVREDLKQQHGFVHGGAVSYLADNALTYAGASVLGQVLTLEMKINYSRPAVGERLIARAVVESSGKRQAVCSCKIYALKDGEEKLCAIAQGTVLTTQ
jgi:acyl-CoA thioesterase